MTSGIIDKKISIRKALAKAKQTLRGSASDRAKVIQEISLYQYQLRVLAYAEMGIELPGAPGQIIVLENPNRPLPNLGKLRMILEQELKEEQERFDMDQHQSDNDIKRLALKEAVLDYYNELPDDFETIIVDYEGDMTLRRDNQDIDSSDHDFAPNKSDIYNRWMEKLEKYIREQRLSDAEFDEAADRGIPQGGAFEKQLDRYRKDFVKRMWQDYYQQEED